MLLKMLIFNCFLLQEGIKKRRPEVNYNETFTNLVTAWIENVLELTLNPRKHLCID